MPKLKTRKALKRRVTVTGSGRVMHSKIGGSHLRRKKHKRTKKLYSKNIEMHPADKKRMQKVPGLRK